MAQGIAGFRSAFRLVEIDRPFRFQVGFTVGWLILLAMFWATLALAGHHTTTSPPPRRLITQSTIWLVGIEGIAGSLAVASAFLLAATRTGSRRARITLACTMIITAVGHTLAALALGVLATVLLVSAMVTLGLPQHPGLGALGPVLLGASAAFLGAVIAAISTFCAVKLIRSGR